MRPQFWGLGLGIWVLGFAAACSQQPHQRAHWSLGENPPSCRRLMLIMGLPPLSLSNA